MKLPQREELNDFSKAIGIGALKGAAFGGLITVGLVSVLKRKTSFFRGPGGLQRNLVYMGPALFCAATSVEFASRRFEEHRRDVMSGILPPEARVQNAATFDKMKSFWDAHQYKIIVAGWAASISGAFWYVNRDKFMTRSQKLVQARVYAQGATVIMLLLSVLISVEFGDTDEKKLAHDKESATNSWMRSLPYAQSASK